MRKRQPSRPGLSYFDANRGRLITEGPDVLLIKAEIEARWPGVIECFFDTEQEEWVLVEKCKDGVDRHCFSTPVLNQRVIDRLQRNDKTAHVQPDIVQKIEREEKELERQFDNRVTEALGEGYERLEHALMGSGLLPFNKVIVNDGHYIKGGAKTVKSGAA